ncbi:MAG: DUF2784 domain-containing protein [Methylomonas sp.]|nr:DUF2784 domain-containing protein [Methylomonas sp.]
MLFRLAADGVILLHLAFIGFVVLGAALAFRWRWMPVIHLPAAAWGVYIEWTRGICPLTYLENALRRRAGQAGYDGGFIEHYVLSIIYPLGLSAEIQWILGGLVLMTNVLIYAGLIRWRMKKRARR